MTATLIFKTNYADGRTPAPPWGYQAKAGKITVNAAGGYQRHENDPGVNWNGMQRADAIENVIHYFAEGAEIACSWTQLLEPGFFAPNPGWCVVGPELHDVNGNTQSELSLLTSQNGVQVKAFGGQMASGGFPANGADKFYSNTFPFPQGVFHACALGVVLSADRTKGRVRYQVDGKVLVDQRCATLYTGSKVYLKQAFYRDPTQAGNKVAAVQFKDLALYAGVGAWDLVTGTPTPPTPPPVDVVAALADVNTAIAELEQTDAWKLYRDKPTTHTYKSHAASVAARAALGG